MIEPIKLHATLRPVQQLNGTLLAGVPIPGPPGPEGPEGPVGPEGPPGQSANIVEYLFSSNTSTPPGTGQVRFNNSNQTLATLMYLDDDQATGEDIGNLLLALPEAGAKLYVQDKDDGTKWQRYEMTGDPVDGGTYVQFPVTWVEGGSALTEQRVMIAIQTPGVQGPPGPQGPPGQSAGRIFYYAPSDASDIAGYKTLLESPSAGAEVTVPVVCTGTGDVSIGNFATEPGVPGEVPWPPGTVFRRIFAATSGGSARLHVEVYKRTSGGTETLVRSETSPAFTNTAVALQDWTVILPYPGIAMTATDRLVSKVYAQRVSGPASITVTCYFEGVYGSHIQTTISAGAQGPVGPQGPAGLPNVIQDEGTPLTVRAAMNFVGAGVTVTDDAADARTVITVPGQTPWTQNVNAAGFSLNGAGDIVGQVIVAQNYFSGKFCYINGTPSASVQVECGGINAVFASSTVVGNPYIGSFSDHAFGIWANSAERIRIAANGNVGIGTSSPGYKLDIAGDCNLSAGSVYRINGVDAKGYMQSPWTGDVDGNSKKLSNVSMLGVGKVPVYVLDVVGEIHSSTAYYCNTKQIMTSDGAATYFKCENAGALIFEAPSGEKMRVEAATGRVGIGTSSPGSKLSVVGLPTSASGLSSGDIWRDSAAGNVLKIVP